MTLASIDWLHVIVHVIISTAMEKQQRDSDNVHVTVRCRPLSETEISQGHAAVVDCDSVRGTVTIKTDRKHHDAIRSFTFDTVFGPDSKQMDVYNATARPIIDSVLEGYNGARSKFN